MRKGVELFMADISTSLTSDEYFYEKELKEVMQYKQQMFGEINLAKLPLPSVWENHFGRKAMQEGEQDLLRVIDGKPTIPYYVNKTKRNYVHIQGIEEQYFDKLNDLDCVEYVGVLEKRKFDYKREFMKDKKTGEVLTEKITKGQGCIAIMSTAKIGVPNKYKPTTDEGFAYVDYKKDDDGITKFIYVIPKKYCYKCNQTALVITSNAGSYNSYYEKRVPLKIGSYIRFLVIPLSAVFSGALSLGKDDADNDIYLNQQNIVQKKSRSVNHPNNITLRVIHTKYNINYKNLIDNIILYWGRAGLLIDTWVNTLSDGYGKIDEANLPYRVFSSDNLFEQYNMDKPMSQTEEFVPETVEDYVEEPQPKGRRRKEV
jgi:hypothetical protein